MVGQWVSIFLWVSLEWLRNVDEFDVTSFSEKTEIGYFIEVYLEYPDNLHNLHNDYPLAPEKRAASSDILSKYCKKNAGEYKKN